MSRDDSYIQCRLAGLSIEEFHQARQDAQRFHQARQDAQRMSGITDAEISAKRDRITELTRERDGLLFDAMLDRRAKIRRTNQALTNAGLGHLRLPLPKLERPITRTRPTRETTSTPASMTDGSRGTIIGITTKGGTLVRPNTGYVTAIF